MNQTHEEWWYKTRAAADEYRHLRRLNRPSPEEQDKIAAFDRALAWLESTPNGAVRGKVIRAIYIDGMTNVGAAMRCYYSKESVQRIRRKFINKLGECLGYR